jgi:hypothetical protein
LAEEQKATRIREAYKEKLKLLAKLHGRNLRQELEYLIDKELKEAIVKEPAT